jgi:hypothetical protein
MFITCTKLIHNCLDYFERLKGTREFKKLKTVSDPSHFYTVLTNTNQEIKIFCDEIIYTVRYSKSWAKDKIYRVYYVHTSFDNNLPDDLKERLSKNLHIGNLLSPFSSIKSRKKAAIEAFVDYIKEEAL